MNGESFGQGVPRVRSRNTASGGIDGGIYGFGFKSANMNHTGCLG